MGQTTVSEEVDLLPYEQRIEQRRRRRIFWGVALSLLVTVFLYFEGRPVLGAIKSWQARRLANKSAAYAGNERWGDAFAEARDGYLLSPGEPETWRALARLLSRTGNGKAALPWWENFGKTRPLLPSDRRDWAEAALAAGDLSTAGTQTNALLGAEHPLPGDFLLGARLAARRGERRGVIERAVPVVEDPAATGPQRLDAAQLILSVSDRDSKAYRKAWKIIEGIGRDAVNPASLDALVLLARTSTPAAPAGGAAGEMNLERLNTDTIDYLSARELADLIDAHPKARAPEKALALELRARADPLRSAEFAAKAVEEFGGGDDQTVDQVCRWLIGSGQAEKALGLLNTDRTGNSPTLARRFLEALSALGQWDKMSEAVRTDHLKLDPWIQHVYMAQAKARLEEPESARIEWERAVTAANSDAGKLMSVGSAAEQSSFLDAAAAAYEAASKADGKARPAYEGQRRVFQLRGQTASEKAVVDRMEQLWPEDKPLAVDAAYLALLLDPTASVEKDVPGGDGLSQDTTRKGMAALVELKQGHTASALALFGPVHGTDPASYPPGVRAIRAAALAANGWDVEAAAEKQALLTAMLRPEESVLMAGIRVP